ncbi:MAG: 50S ribosomal protein L11 methyltransferase [Deltaproteobacteria bacterium]|nr:MAG: 50S ribosomal protein L11 methyltransferase [Deltaproteobacteria bacterium]
MRILLMTGSATAFSFQGLGYNTTGGKKEFAVEKWKVLKIRVNRRLIDPLSGFLFSRGTLGLSYDEETFREEEEADIEGEDDFTEVKAYFSPDFDLRGMLPDLKRFVASVSPLADSFAVDTVEIEDYGWTEKWKEFFRPVRVGEKVVVTPSWENYEPEGGEVVLVIDPGEAFGTGSHETTRLCLEFIEKVFRDSRPRRCIDVGCGTGILAILMAKLGAEEVLAQDIDVKAVEIAGKNAAINGVGDRVKTTGLPLSRLGGGFDLASANILAEVLVEMASEFRLKVREGGHLILSGILREKLDWVRDEFALEKFREVERKSEGLWGALLMRRE